MRELPLLGKGGELVTAELRAIVRHHCARDTISCKIYPQFIDDLHRCSCGMVNIGKVGKVVGGDENACRLTGTGRLRLGTRGETVPHPAEGAHSIAQA